MEFDTEASGVAVVVRLCCFCFAGNGHRLAAYRFKQRTGLSAIAEHGISSGCGGAEQIALFAVDGTERMLDNDAAGIYELVVSGHHGHPLAVGGAAEFVPSFIHSDVRQQPLVSAENLLAAVFPGARSGHEDHL